mmetsp:Transcript_29357/g.45192  ORF Transcript_29357/g.45192 Transcript_29357/m.45192 type:complete len:106 (-) Transcript_29357:39-356(-)
MELNLMVEIFVLHMTVNDPLVVVVVDAGVVDAAEDSEVEIAAAVVDSAVEIVVDVVDSVVEIAEDVVDSVVEIVEPILSAERKLPSSNLNNQTCFLLVSCSNYFQ